jgi:hypothetical protein
MGFTQQLLLGAKVILAGFTEKTEDRWRIARCLKTGFLLTVQDAQGVALHAALAVRAQSFFSLS